MNEQEQLRLTIEEGKNIVSALEGEIANNNLRLYFELGHLILNCPLYRKGQKGTGKLIKQFCQAWDRSSPVIYAAIKAVKVFGNIEKCVEDLSKQLGKPYINWTDVLTVINPRVIREASCRYCKIPGHCKGA